MIPEHVERHIETVGDVKEQRAGLAAGCERFVFDALRKLYKDRIKSIMREYFANAKDEHNKIGASDLPFEVTFPNSLSPTLTIRDFANGLSEEDVFYYFGNYGASDKRESNVAIGKFGFGNKSALAYTDAFNISSFYNGVKMDFTHYIDQSEVGILAKLGESETTEPNGILISIPVKSYDINQFSSKGIELIQHFKVRPTIKGLSAIPDFAKKSAIIAGTNWEYFGSGKAVCLMGEIAYPLDPSVMGNLEGWERTLLLSDLHITVEIGDVEVTPSREELQMSEKTVNAIKSRLKIVQTEMLAETQKQFTNCKTLFEAKSLYYATIMSGSGYGAILRDSMSSIFFDGHLIRDNVIDLRDGNFEPHRILNYNKNWRSRKLINYSTEPKLNCVPDMVLYFDDTDKKIVNYKRRAKTLLDAGATQVLIVQTDDAAEFEKLTGLKVTDLKSYNAIVPTAVSNRVGYGTGSDPSKKAKHQTRAFVLDRTQTATGYKLKAASDYWTVKTVKLEKALYVPIAKFHPTLPNIDNMEMFKRVLDVLETFGIKCRLPIVGLKAGADSGDLVRFDTWLTKKVGRLKGLKADAELSRAYERKDFYETTFDETVLPDGNMAREYIALVKKAKMLYNESRNRNRNFLIDKANLSYEASTKVAEKSKEFLAAYPMMAVVDDNLARYNDNPERIKTYLTETKAMAATAQ